MAIAFIGGLVIIGDGRILEHGTVLLDGQRITKVIEGEMDLPPDTRKIPLEGRTVLPGFIDCHVHLCLDGGPDPISSVITESVPMTTLKAVQFARDTLMAGVTTVRDLGGKEEIALVLRDAICSGLISGPRMLVSRQMICMTGGHGWPVGREADGPDEVRKAVRQQIKKGADLVKFMATGGVLTPGVEPGAAQLTEEELRAGIEEAHKAGRKTATHAMGTEGTLNALRAGIDSIEHGVYLDDQSVSLMVKQGVALVPTLSALYNIEAKGIEGGIPEYAVEKTKRVKPYHLSSIRMARETGVRIAMGTDAGTPFNMHGENIGELKFLVEQGFSPIEAIQAGTRIAAEVLGMESDLGSIEEGKLADLVVVEGNPLDNIGLLRDPEAIKLVVQGGKIVKGNLDQS
ncbi:MAG: amidohydrolase family protein [Deltaproteobacteria bacterium]|nr:amidohydrolase family protein [Deltaproteobacteria bacterium]MBW1934546.1 amidohydrolase family protein [Deltaproteobacteria bacterium]MBW1977010.1 amidohydrolase family protein [Deltaproteobacteria bacterium]MBW2044061.1 amidohydrolase family protein [Deltaproteobacteria bacterium]MBW2299098.1 amidohydrolase family protein [Deltaproteobacteria bacterium]